MNEMERWPNLIGLMTMAKQDLYKVDPETGYGVTVPHLGASEEQLAALERELGEPLDPQLRELLSHINGWEEFHIEDELLSTAQLGDPVLRAELLEALELTIEYLPLRAEDWLVFVRSPSTRTLMVIGRPGTQHAGQVIWLSGEEIDRFTDLREWFLSMIQSHRRGLEKALDKSR